MDVMQQDVLGGLGAVVRRGGLTALGERLAELAALVAGDMGEVERALGTVPPADDRVTASAHHLLALSGKRLRPVCVMLASRVGRGFEARARELAVAVELVHTATLLHDDVVDLGDVRRGAPAARVLYGNAASVFAGDWLLVEALRRVRATGLGDVLDRLLTVIDEMIRAEAIQLERRGRIDTDEAVWRRIVEGKTAALFRWAMLAGARAGELPASGCAALERYGVHLGVAFQIVDDVLDLTGDETVTGKALFTDLREGKMTHPLIVGVARDPSLRDVLERIAAGASDAPVPEALRSRVLASLAGTDAVPESMSLARARVAEAVRCLDELPPGPAVDALVTAADAALAREK